MNNLGVIEQHQQSGRKLAMKDLRFIRLLSVICLVAVLTSCQQKNICPFSMRYWQPSLSQSFNLPPSWQNQMILFFVFRNETHCYATCLVLIFLNRNSIWWLQSCGERARFQSTSRRVDSVASSASVSTATYYYSLLQADSSSWLLRVCQSCETMATLQHWILQQRNVAY